jgi:hypothetical protein
VIKTAHECGSKWNYPHFNHLPPKIPLHMARELHRTMKTTGETKSYPEGRILSTIVKDKLRNLRCGTFLTTRIDPEVEEYCRWAIEAGWRGALFYLGDERDDSMKSSV